MQLKMVIAIIVFMGLVLTGSSRGAAIHIVDSVMIVPPVDSLGSGGARVYVTGAYLDDSSVFVSGGAGLLFREMRSSNWSRLLPVEPHRANWWEDLKVAKSSGAIFSPGRIYPDKDRSILLFDNSVGRFYRVEWNSSMNAASKLRKDSPRADAACVFDGRIFYCTWSGPGNPLLMMSDEKGHHWKNLLECPQSLYRKVTTLGGNLQGTPAYDPIDRTVWLALMFYNIVYEVDLTGTLVDSIVITDPEYRLPKLPVSRLNTNAVFQDWFAKLTPIEGLWCVSSGYIILQFKTVKDEHDSAGTRLLKTTAWNCGGGPIDLGFERGWRIVGVQSDGRILLVDDKKLDLIDRPTVLLVGSIK